jgi:copper resistance protein C
VRFSRTSAVGLIVALLLSLFSVATPAFAHDVLVGSDPVVGSTESSIPEDVTLTFNDKILNFGANSNQIVVKDPMGMVISSGAAHISGTQISEVLSPKMLMMGTYTVSFRIVSADGHPVSGSYTFKVAAKASPAPGVKVLTSGAKSLTVALSGKNIAEGEGFSGATGKAGFVADFAKQQLCYWVSLSPVPQITAIHVHPLNMKDLKPSDLIYVPIDLKALKANAKAPFCQTESRITLSNLTANPNRFLLMVHSQKYPEGAESGIFKLSN